MAVVTDNQRPWEPEQNQPAPRQEPRLDPEQLRQFQEFQRFQAYLRFTATSGTATQGDEIQPWTPPQVPVPAQETTPVPYRLPEPPAADPPTPPTGNPLLHRQLAGVQRQLTELTEAQRRAERATNPPLWRKILRNKWVHRLIALIVLLLVGSWLFGPKKNETKEQQAKPITGEEMRVPERTPLDAVYFVYYQAAGLPELHTTSAQYKAATELCGRDFTPPGSDAFGRAFGKDRCADALLAISKLISNPDAYGEQFTSNTGLHFTSPGHAYISSCELNVEGGPLLGKFTLTRDSNGGWPITGFSREHRPCPTTTSGPPESTEPTTPPS